MVKKFIFNIFCVLFFILLIEFFSLLIYTNQTYVHIKGETFFNRFKSNIHCYFQPKDTFENEFDWISTRYFRKPVGEIFSKKSMVFFGCSIIYGANLTDEETLSYKLSQYTKRPAYNYALSTWGIQHILYMCRNGFIFDKVKNPEYFFYVYVVDHKRRLFLHQNLAIGGLRPYLRYELDKNNNLLEIRHFSSLFGEKLYFVKLLQLYLSKKMQSDFEITSEVFFAELNEINSYLKSKYPNSKLVILMYQDQRNDFSGKIYDDSFFFEKNEFARLKKMNIETVNLETITNKKFKSPEYYVDDWHPSAKYWDEIVPLLAKKLDL